MLRRASFPSSREADEKDAGASKVQPEGEEGEEEEVESVCRHIDHRPQAAAALLRQLSALRDEGRLTDLRLRTDDGRCLPCHRLVLAASCPYFDAMFASGMGEAEAGEVTLHEVPGAVLRQLVDYCYTGCLTLTPANVHAVAEVASFLQFRAVEDECVSFLQSRLSAANSLETEQVAKRLFNRQLSASARDFSVGHFGQVALSPDFLQFSAEEVGGLVADGVSVDSEEEVYEAVVRWVYHDEEERRSRLAGLMEKLLFEVMAESYVLEIAAKEPLLQADSDCMAIVKRARAYQATCRGLSGRVPSPQLQAKAQAMRNYSEVIFLIGQFTYRMEGSSEVTSSLLMYEPRQRKWDEMFGSPFCAKGGEFATAAAAVGNDVVAVTNHHRSWLFASGPAKWSLLTGRMEGRNGGCLVALDGEAYIVGGLKPSESTRMAGVQRLDSATRQWVDVEPLPAGMIHATAVSCLGKIYLIGSTSGSRYITEMLCYGPQVGRWAACPSLPTRLARPKVLAVDGRLYVLGHQSDTAMAMLRFDVRSRSWTTVEGPLVARHGAAFTVCNSRLYLLGGRVEASDFTETEEFTVECYDPESEIWSLHGDALFTLDDHQEVTILNPAFPPSRYLGPKQH